VGIAIDVAGTKDEASAELEGVPAQAVLAMAGGPRPLPGSRVVATQEVEKGAGSEARGAIRFSPLVDQEREGDARLLPEEAGIVPVAEPDGGQARAFLPECLLLFAQLRDVLAAEHSAVMPEEDQDREAVGPQ